MARRTKKGLDYYPQDVDLFTDRKIKRLIADFGAKGYLVYEFVKARCYKENGYWAQCDENFCFDVGYSLNADTSEAFVTEVLQACINRYSLFSKKVFDDQKVITSAGIQRRYLEAKRCLDIVDSIWIIELPAPPEILTGTQEGTKGTLEGTKGTQEGTKGTQPGAKSTERKEEKSKEEESTSAAAEKSNNRHAYDITTKPLPYPPTRQQVHEFFYQQGRPDKSESELFYHHYEALDWRVGITPIINWRSMASRWIARPPGSLPQETRPYPSKTELQLLAKYAVDG